MAERDRALATRQQELQRSIEALDAQRSELAAARGDLDAKLQRLEEQANLVRVDREKLAKERRALNTERERLEEFALEQTEQFAHLERQRDAESEVVLAAPEVEEVIEMPGYREPVMGEQFEHVDPVLLGEPKQKQSAASAASTVAEEKKIAPERVPVDPAADEAYEELVDRLVQFNYSKKKRWYKFW